MISQGAAPKHWGPQRMMSPETPHAPGGEGTQALSLQAGQAFLAHPRQAMALGSASPVPPLLSPSQREQLPPTARAGKRGQLPAPPGVALHNLLPSPPKEAAEILLSPVLLHLSCKNRKNPTVLAGTSVASESIFPAPAGKEKYKLKSPQQSTGRHAG